MADVSKPKHRKVQVWIWARSPRGDVRVLLLRMIPERGGWWQPVTGGVEKGEALAAAAWREAAEETGFDFEGEAKPIGYEFRFDGRWGPAHETVFALRVPREAPPRLDPKEHVEHRWVSPEEARALLNFDSNREALARLLEWIDA